ELHLGPLPNGEVLENAQVGIEIRGPVNYGECSRPVLADLIRRSEATRVDELIRSEILARVAGDHRRQRDVGRAQQRSGTDVERRAGNLVAVQRQSRIELVALYGYKIPGTTFN